MSYSNKDFDSEFCGSLPLHQINQIQPHGVLIVLDKQNYKIVQVSENISSFIGIDTSVLLNQLLQDLIVPEDFNNLKFKLEKWSLKKKVSLNLKFINSKEPVEFIAFVHPGETYIVMELEFMGQETRTFYEIYQEVNYILSALKNTSNLKELANIVAIETKNFSGFDKVMVYRFDKKWNGTVIAEAKEENMDSYLNLRFPASDIPTQARDLYFKIPLRAIPDVDFQPSRLIPVINPLSTSFTDLSECNLRSVPSVHLEYLKNMGIKASFSIPLIVNNALWGLISFHHRSSKYLSYGLRIGFELLSSFISLQLTYKEIEQDIKLKSKLNELNIKVLSRIIKEDNIVDALLGKSPHLLELLHITGAAIKFEDAIHVLGVTPSTREIGEIFSWINIMNIKGVYTSDNFSANFPDSFHYKGKASGIIIIPISSKKGEYIVGFRQEIVEQIEWGGNPNEAINFEPDGRNYHPRKSFERYKETVEGVSEPWLIQEIEAAETLKTAILEQIIKEKT